MSNRQCIGQTKDGKACNSPPHAGRDYCLWHDPDKAEERREQQRRGGHARRNELRVLKAIPQDARGIGDLLLQAIVDVRDGTLSPMRGNAMANLARAYLAVYETGSFELRLHEIEVAINERKKAA